MGPMTSIRPTSSSGRVSAMATTTIPRTAPAISHGLLTMPNDVTTTAVTSVAVVSARAGMTGMGSRNVALIRRSPVSQGRSQTAIEAHQLFS